MSPPSSSCRRALLAAAAVLAVLATAASPAAAGNSTAIAEQLHISLTGNSSTMAVSFVSAYSACAVSYKAAASGANSSVASISEAMDEIGYLHYAVLTGLSGTNSTYWYQIACRTATGSTVWAPLRYSFVHNPVREGGLVNVFFADFGLNNDQSMASLNNQTNVDAVDMVLFGGDIAYDLRDNNSVTGNEFMNALQNLAAQKPMMMAVGNHEANGPHAPGLYDADGNFLGAEVFTPDDPAENFEQYCRRFRAIAETTGRASGSNSNFYYSWDAGLVHYVAIMTEVYIYPNQTLNSPYPFKPEEQLAWLEQDLAAANARRSQTPWIVVFGHKGWFMDYEPDKKHLPHSKLVTNFTQFNPILVAHKVDLYLCGHVHLYQRFLPLNGPAEHKPLQRPQDIDHACASDDKHVYTNPKYPVQIVAGSPGDQEKTTEFMCDGTSVAFSQIVGSQVACSNNYGYGRMRIVNATHLFWEWIETAPGSKLLFGASGETLADEGDMAALTADARSLARTSSPPLGASVHSDYLWIVKDA